MSAKNNLDPVITVPIIRDLPEFNAIVSRLARIDGVRAKWLAEIKRETIKIQCNGSFQIIGVHMRVSTCTAIREWLKGVLLPGAEIELLSFLVSVVSALKKYESLKKRGGLEDECFFD